MECSVPWGEWMGADKVDAKDEEAARLDRQKVRPLTETDGVSSKLPHAALGAGVILAYCIIQAAFGAETLSKMKNLNVLVIGMRGTGVETAKNLILSNVGAVIVWDPQPTDVRDLGESSEDVMMALPANPANPTCME